MWKREELMAYFALGLKLSLRLVIVLDQHHPLSLRMIHHSYDENWSRIERAVLTTGQRPEDTPMQLVLTTFTKKGWKVEFHCTKQDESLITKWYFQTTLKPVVKSKKRTRRGIVRGTFYLKDRDDLLRWIHNP